MNNETKSSKELMQYKEIVEWAKKEVVGVRKVYIGLILALGIFFTAVFIVTSLDLKSYKQEMRDDFASVKNMFELKTKALEDQYEQQLSLEVEKAKTKIINQIDEEFNKDSIAKLIVTKTTDRVDSTVEKVIEDQVSLKLIPLQEDINKFSELQAESALFSITTSGRWLSGGEESKHLIASKIRERLEYLGIDQIIINEIFEGWHIFILGDYAHLIFYKLHEFGKDKDILINYTEFFPEEEFIYDIEHLPNPDHIRKLLNEKDIDSIFLNELINDYEYYLTNKEHRRIEMWFNQYIEE
ncbi:MAG: hypothetical protein ISS80_00760 [Candidatus Cloacimonetes bacterium]|nr:hypothetical protein [Candidatus Cloacimonadota bacterium]MBL7148586.1 hypothetical protein [Candidatus Cloacimonadota bacterium]